MRHTVVPCFMSHVWFGRHGVGRRGGISLDLDYHRLQNMKDKKVGLNGTTVHEVDQILDY